MRTKIGALVISTLLLAGCATRTTTVSTAPEPSASAPTGEVAINVAPVRGQTADQQASDVRDCELSG